MCYLQTFTNKLNYRRNIATILWQHYGTHVPRNMEGPLHIMQIDITKYTTVTSQAILVFIIHILLLVNTTQKNPI